MDPSMMAAMMEAAQSLGPQLISSVNLFSASQAAKA